MSLIKTLPDTNEYSIRVNVLYNQFLNRRSKLKDVFHRINDFLTEIRSFKSKELNKFICNRFIKLGISTPLMLSVDSDLDNSSINILHISSSGLGLPDRDYYFDKKHKNILIEYRKFMEKYLKLFGNFDYNNILLIEEKLAECSYTKVERRNPHLMNNKYDLDVIDCNFKKFYIKDILSLLNLSPESKINISNYKIQSNFLL